MLSRDKSREPTGSGELLPTLQIEVEKEHSYFLPDLIELPIIDGSPNYLNWIAEELEGGS